MKPPGVSCPLRVPTHVDTYRQHRQAHDGIHGTWAPSPGLKGPTWTSGLPGRPPDWVLRVARQWATACCTRSAASSTGTCSHIRRTVHPASERRRSVSASRSRFRVTFSAQKSALAFAAMWCFGHPCQKQPSRKTARRAVGKTRSAVRLIVLTGRRFTKYRRPCACTARLSASSGPVSRPRLPLIVARTAGEDAHDDRAAICLSVIGKSVEPGTLASRRRPTRLRHPSTLGVA